MTVNGEVNGSLESLFKDLVKKVERLEIIEKELQKLKDTEEIKCLMNKYGTPSETPVLKIGILHGQAAVQPSGPTVFHSRRRPQLLSRRNLDWKRRHQPHVRTYPLSNATYPSVDSLAACSQKDTTDRLTAGFATTSWHNM